MPNSYHLPVLAQESVEALNLSSGSVAVDVTFGGGGHSRLILEQLGPQGRLIAFDQDADALENAPDDQRLTLVQHNFRHLQRFLRLHEAVPVNAILADLGVSSHQLDVAERGFSFRFDADLDMRMNQQQATTAADLLNRYTAEELQHMFSVYGEVRNAKTLAQRIVAERQQQSLTTIGQLVHLMEPLIRGQRARYLAQVFQAIRIAVNDEMGALEDFLAQALEVLAPGGRLVIIAYHSIEDRMVKHFLKTGNVQGEQKKDDFGRITRPFQLITRKAVPPSEEEIKNNPRARSAKMRVGEKVE